MRIKQRWRFVLMNSILILALLSGCTYGASRTGSPSGMTRLSQTTQELIAAQPGPLAGTHFYLAHDPQRSDIANILDRLPPWSTAWMKRWCRRTGRSCLPKTKMQLAKEAIQAFAESLPEGARVSLRVYGHKGSNADEHKQLSCGSSELVYPLQPFDAERLAEALHQFEPTGWTSIARSLQNAKAGSESYNFLNAFMNLNRLKILDSETVSQLEKIEKEQEKLIRQRGKEMEAFLRELNDKTYKETIDAINKQFHENVQKN